MKYKDAKKRICKDEDLPWNFIIEGDNLEALVTLSYTHAGKIDVIYIDPPYNTGNKDFVYNDSWRRHQLFTQSGLVDITIPQGNGEGNEE